MKVSSGLGTSILAVDWGNQWRQMAINKFGQTNGRDNYIGLTDRQWRLLGERYSKVINETYYNLTILTKTLVT